SGICRGRRGLSAGAFGVRNRHLTTSGSPTGNNTCVILGVFSIFADTRTKKSHLRSMARCGRLRKQSTWCIEIEQIAATLDTYEEDCMNRRLAIMASM